MKRHHYLIQSIILLYTIASVNNLTASLAQQAQAQLESCAYSQAISSYTQLINQQPDNCEYWYNLGYCYRIQKQIHKAVECFSKVIELYQQFGSAYAQLGECYSALGNNDDALHTFQKGLIEQPTHIYLHIALARLHVKQSNNCCANACFEHAMRLNPKDTALLLEYAQFLCAQRQYFHAYELYKQVGQLYPESTQARYNIAYALKRLGNYDQAAQLYEAIIAQDPEHANAHFSLAGARLIQGDLLSGFAEYEWRWKRGDMAPRTFSKPVWDGTAQPGTTILLHAEQGFGDTFQFIRYAQSIHDLGMNVVAVVQPALVTIISQCPYIDQVVAMGQPIPAFDVHAPLLSLPYILKTTLETIPHASAYLHADEALTSTWRDALAHDTGIKIGVCWQGNTGYNDAFLQSVVAEKSIAPQLLTHLTTIPGTSWYSLQRESKDCEQTYELPIKKFDSLFDRVHGRFMDTAALIKNLDLVITVDTSIAHLAAGLGARVWLLLPEPCDWRWLLDRTDSPWYPTMKLFRQSNCGSWNNVLDQLHHELHALIIKRNAQESNSILTEISVGELIDKITILELKQLHISDAQKLQNIEHELESLLTTYQEHVNETEQIKQLKQDLYNVNKQLWDIEDAIRDKERAKEFDELFIAIARSVYICNDKRCHVKRLINQATQSTITEEKSYAPY